MEYYFVNSVKSSDGFRGWATAHLRFQKTPDFRTVSIATAFPLSPTLIESSATYRKRKKQSNHSCQM
jgi:hypothetical protein